MLELGTIFLKGKLYNLNFMQTDEMKKLLNMPIDPEKYAVLQRVYEYRVTQKITKEKVDNQISSVNYQIKLINNKFDSSSKNYELIRNELDSISNEYEKILRKICFKYDEKIEKNIFKSLKYEKKISNLSGDNKKVIINLKKELREIKQKICDLSDEKVKKVFDAMESDEKRVSTKISKPKTFEKFTRFFANKFNTYNVITKKILNPIKQRIEDYLNLNPNLDDVVEKEFNLNEFQSKIEKIKKRK